MGTDRTLSTDSTDSLKPDVTNNSNTSFKSPHYPVQDQIHHSPGPDPSQSRISSLHFRTNETRGGASCARPLREEQLPLIHFKGLQTHEGFKQQYILRALQDISQSDAGSSLLDC